MAILLVVAVPAAASATTTTTATDFKVFVTNGNTIHDLNIKASQGADGQVIPVSGFVIDPEDVILLKQGQNLVIMTSTNEPQMKVEEMKVEEMKAQ
jgi:hypothetical protein